jgi:hypothetical protein
VRLELVKAKEERAGAQEEAELTLLQLHQVQEELEHYFLLSRQQVRLLERHRHAAQRSLGLIRESLAPAIPQLALRP